MLNKLKLSILSTSTLLLLAACGGETTTTEDPAGTVDDPAVEEPTDSSETADDTADDTAGDTTDDTAGDTTDDTTNNTADTTSGISNVTFDVSLEDAVQTFLDNFGVDVNIDEIDFDEDSNTYTYEISGWDANNEYDMEIDATTGDIIQQESDTEENNDETDVINVDNIISPQEAMDIAEQELGADTVIDGWTIEVDDGITVYEIDTEGITGDITLNAETGAVVDR